MSLSDGAAEARGRARPDPFDPAGFDPKDPDPWMALYLDQSLPIDDGAKRALLMGARSWSRRWLFPVSRPLVLLFFCVVKVLRAISPRFPNLNGLLHRTIHWGLRVFGTPETNNLNVFNFIIELNAALRAQGRELTPPERVDFSMISDEFPTFEAFPKGPLNFVDVQTAVEFYTPLYALMLPRRDFVRAAHSLQLDETVAIYIARILGTDYHLAFIKNGHPMVALSTLQAGFRLMMHGLDCEALHGWLRLLKARQAAGLPLDPRSPTAAAEPAA